MDGTNRRANGRAQSDRSGQERARACRKLRTEKEELDFFGHALLVLSDDTVELARASIASLLRLPTAKTHLQGNGDRESGLEDIRGFGD